MNAMYWIVLFVVLLVIELVTLGLATIWFAAGALAAFGAAALGGSLTLQFVLFVAVSLALMAAARPFAVKCINKGRVKTNVESLIGQTARVTEPIDNFHGTGSAIVNGLPWTARSSRDDVRIEREQSVTIVGIQGVKLIVEEQKEGGIV